MTATFTAPAAIAAALAHNWKEAIHINTQLLKITPNDIAALNRMGYAYAQNGQRTMAKTTFEKALSLDPYNQIALKHTKNLGSVRKKADTNGVTFPRISPLSFLEEPGVTKIVGCVNLAPAQTLSGLTPGMELTLKTKNHCVEVRLSPNTYVAALPDDLSFKLLRLMASGNAYRAIVKSVDKKSLILILREVTRGKKFANQPSFTAPAVSFSSPSTPHGSLDHENGKMTDTGGEDGDAAQENESEESE